MKINLATIVRKTKAFTEYSSNPIQYREVATHNAMIDVDCALELGAESTTVARLVEMTGMPLEYYARQLPILLRDGYVELTEPKASSYIETQVERNAAGPAGRKFEGEPAQDGSVLSSEAMDELVSESERLGLYETPKVEADQDDSDDEVAGPEDDKEFFY